MKIPKPGSWTPSKNGDRNSKSKNSFWSPIALEASFLLDTLWNSQNESQNLFWSRLMGFIQRLRTSGTTSKKKTDVVGVAKNAMIVTSPVLRNAIWARTLSLGVWEFLATVKLATVVWRRRKFEICLETSKSYWLSICTRWRRRKDQVSMGRSRCWLTLCTRRDRLTRILMSLVTE